MKNIIMYILVALLIGGVVFYFTHKSFVLGRVGMTFTNKPIAAEKTDVIGEAAKTNRKILVAYFSWGGNTRKVAQNIHSLVGGDVVEIRPVKEYPEGYKDTVKVGKQELDSGVLPEITFAKLDMKDYDTILLGYPIWYYREPLVIEKFLRSVDTDGKTIIPFATSGGSPIEPSLNTIQKAAPKAKMGQELMANDSSLIKPWLEKHKLLK